MKLIKKKIDFNEAIKENNFIIKNTSKENFKKALDLLHRHLVDYCFSEDARLLFIKSTEYYSEDEGGDYFLDENDVDLAEYMDYTISINDIDFLNKYKYEDNKEK